MKKTKAIVAVTNDLYTDQRVDKVCNFLLKQGYEVLLVGRKRKDSLPLQKRSYKTHRMKLIFEKKAFFYAEYNFRLFLFLIFRRSNLLLANDLDTLLACYLAHCCKPRTRLVYDSHEYFTEVPELNGRKAKKVWETIEKWIFPKLKTVYTVNESIAKIYNEKYNKKLFVVRNIAPFWNPTFELKSRLELGLPLDKHLIIMQGSGINVNRGAEEAVKAMVYIDNACLIFVGDGDVIPQLKRYVNEHYLEEKVMFFGKMPYNKMMNFTHHASIGLSLDKGDNYNYEYSLPNKIFDYIQTLTPIICTPRMEVKNVVEKYQVGCVIDPLTPENLAEKIKMLLINEKLYKQLKENCYKTKTTLNWENETSTLARIYPKIQQKL